MSNLTNILKWAIGHGRGIEGCVQDAESGNPKAQYALGIFYEQGQLGLNVNYSEAAKWYKKSAIQGHAAAQLCLGILFAQGKGVELDFIEAYKWLSLAKHGNFTKIGKALDKIAASETLERVTELMNPQQRLTAGIQFCDLVMALNHGKQLLECLEPQPPPNPASCLYLNAVQHPAIMKKASLIINSTYGDLTDLSEEIRNTIANIYYRFQIQAVHAKDEHFFPAGGMEGLKQYMDECNLNLEEIKLLPEFVKCIRHAAKNSLVELDFLTTTFLSMFKYHIPNIAAKTLDELKSTFPYYESNVREIPDLWELL